MLREISTNDAIRLAFTGMVLVFKPYDTNEHHGFDVTPLSEFGTINQIKRAAEQGGYRFFIEEERGYAGVQGYEDRVSTLTAM